VLLQDLKPSTAQVHVKFVVRERPGTESDGEPATALPDRTDRPRAWRPPRGDPGAPPTMNTK